MSSLVLALYAEGRADERFLPIVIQRTAEHVLGQQGLRTTDVLEPIVLDYSMGWDVPPRRDARILEAARRSHGYHALVIHADADHPTPDRAFEDRIRPGLSLIQQTEDPVCGQLIPIIPVQTTEAWMLVDPDALCDVIKTNVQPHSLGMPVRAHQVESDPTPKQTFREVIQRALANRPRRRRHIDVADIQGPLARQIRLERLRRVSSYQQFEHSMIAALIALHMIE